MEWNEWFLSVAAIIFGSGMLGRLVEFFVKRHDEQKANKIALYKELYEKLCDYSSFLGITLLDYFKCAQHYSDSIDVKCTIVDEHIANIKNLRKEIRSFQRKCKKGEQNEDMCYLCTLKRNDLSQLFEILNNEVPSVRDELYICLNYWVDNFEQIYKGLCDNMNLRKMLFRINCKEKDLLLSIRLVDKCTIEMSQKLLVAKENKDFGDEIVSQMENIELCLIRLSKIIK